MRSQRIVSVIKWSNVLDSAKNVPQDFIIISGYTFFFFKNESSFWEAKEWVHEKKEKWPVQKNSDALLLIWRVTIDKCSFQVKRVSGSKLRVLQMFSTRFYKLYPQSLKFCRAKHSIHLIISIFCRIFETFIRQCRHHYGRKNGNFFIVIFFNWSAIHVDGFIERCENKPDQIIMWSDDMTRNRAPKKKDVEDITKSQIIGSAQLKNSFAIWYIHKQRPQRANGTKKSERSTYTDHIEAMVSRAQSTHRWTSCQNLRYHRGNLYAWTDHMCFLAGQNQISGKCSYRTALILQY